MTKNPKIRLFTIGYQTLDGPHVLAGLCDILKAQVWDIRAKPVSRRPQWHGSNLRMRLEEKYQWHGDILGGLGREPTPEGLKFLRIRIEKTPIILLCQEEAPGECHRHDVVIKSGIPALHIYRNEVISSLELERANIEDTEYQFEELSEFLRRVS